MEIKEASTGFRYLSKASFFMVLYVLSGWGLPVLTERAYAQEDPVKAISSLAAYTVQTVGNKKFSLAQRRQYATRVIDQRFNVEKLGKLALGTIWRRLRSGERQAFLSKFRELMIEDFIWWFSDYDGQSYEVVGATRDSQDSNTVFIEVEYRRNAGQKITTLWRIENENGVNKVLDIKVEGLSLLSQLRGEYRSAYSRGRSRELTRFMEQRISKRRRQLGG